MSEMEMSAEGAAQDLLQAYWNSRICISYIVPRPRRSFCTATYSRPHGRAYSMPPLRGSLEQVEAKSMRHQAGRRRSQRRASEHSQTAGQPLKPQPTRNNCKHLIERRKRYGNEKTTVRRPASHGRPNPRIRSTALGWIGAARGVQILYLRLFFP